MEFTLPWRTTCKPQTHNWFTSRRAGPKWIHTPGHDEKFREFEPCKYLQLNSFIYSNTVMTKFLLISAHPRQEMAEKKERERGLKCSLLKQLTLKFDHYHHDHQWDVGSLHFIVIVTFRRCWYIFQPLSGWAKIIQRNLGLNLQPHDHQLSPSSSPGWANAERHEVRWVFKASCTLLFCLFVLFVYLTFCLCLCFCFIFFCLFVFHRP